VGMERIGMPGLVSGSVMDPTLLRPQSRLLDEQAGFAGVMAQARGGDEGTPEQRARTAAEQLVSTALVQPIFKRLRESNNAAAPFGPNQAERMFGSMLDARHAERMVSSQRWGLVDQLARRMLTKAGVMPTPAIEVQG